MPETPDTELLDLTAGIVAAHVSNNTVGDRRWATLAARKRLLLTQSGHGAQRTSLIATD